MDTLIGPVFQPSMENIFCLCSKFFVVVLDEPTLPLISPIFCVGLSHFTCNFIDVAVWRFLVFFHSEIILFFIDSNFFIGH